MGDNRFHGGVVITPGGVGGGVTVRDGHGSSYSVGGVLPLPRNHENQQPRGEGGEVYIPRNPRDCGPCAEYVYPTVSNPPYCRPLPTCRQR